MLQSSTSFAWMKTVLGASRSRFHRRKIARHGINEQLLAFGRFNVLRESSLPIIVHTLQQEGELLPPGEEPPRRAAGSACQNRKLAMIAGDTM